LTAGELVYSLHGDVPDGMFEMALEPFTAGVLWKLAEDCKVGFELAGGNRRWLLNERAGEFESLKH
jgi:hydrolase